MPRRTGRGVPRRGYARRWCVPAVQTRPPAVSTPPGDTGWRSSASLLLQSAQGALGVFDVLACEFSGLNQVHHDRLDTSFEKPEQLVDQPALCGLARDNRFEDVGVADL